jgi:D-alanyl-D-alanine carboxypeptidase (penicillin-binding protein 5/6)
MRSARSIVVSLALAACATLHAAESNPRAPEISAKAWILVDYDSGQVLSANKAETRVAAASLSHLAVAYVIFQKLREKNLRLSDMVLVSARAADTQGARMFLRADEQVSIEQLLKGMISVSANDAALALAEHIAGTEGAFTEQMNAVAQTMRLTGTRFRDVNGQSANDGNLSSARDLARLASALLRDFPEYYGWFALREFMHNGIRQYNRNALLWRDGSVDGMKAGQTRDAGFSLVAAARRGEMRLIAVLLVAPDENARVLGVQTLLEYGFRHYETRRLYRAKTKITRVRVWMGSSDAVDLGLPNDATLTLPRGWHERVRARTTVAHEQTAPIQSGQTIGSLTLELDGDTVAEYPLVALKHIRRGNVFQRGLDHLQRWLH